MRVSLSSRRTSPLVFDRTQNNQAPHVDRYYVSALLLVDDRPQAASLLAGDHLQAQKEQKEMRVPAGDIEGLVLERLRALFSSMIEVSDALASLHLEARALDVALRNAFKLSQRWLAAPPVALSGARTCKVRAHQRPVILRIRADGARDSPLWLGFVTNRLKQIA